jgi:predicted Na+-dependent transporter
MSSPLSIASRVLQSTETPTAAPTLGEYEKEPLDVFAAVMTNILLFFLIFGLSASVRLQDLKHQLTNKFAIFTGVAMQFLIMPFLGFCSVMAFKGSGYTEAMGVSLLVVTASPGGSYSNWWCSLFNAELALSVAMTSVSSIISLGLLPANLFFYSWLAYTVILDEEEDLDVIGALDFEAIFITLGVVLGAIIGGLWVGYRFDAVRAKKNFNHFGSFCGIALILFSAFLGSGGGDADVNFWSFNWSFYVGTALPCILGMALANMISRSLRLSPPEVVAISIECCYQNTAIATSVAVTMFTDPNERAEAISVPLFYGLIEAVIIGIYCVWAWKVGWTKAPADEKLCVVVSKTYEVGSEETEEEEWEGELPHHWYARLFVPREIERKHAAESQDANDISMVPSDKKAAGQEGPRDRFESADVTVATALNTPPGTPEASGVETILQEKDSHIIDTSDVEMQSPSRPKNSLLHHEYKIDEDADADGYPTDESQSPPSNNLELTKHESFDKTEPEAKEKLFLRSGPSMKDVMADDQSSNKD